jgi:hypothetical protein
MIRIAMEPFGSTSISLRSEERRHAHLCLVEAALVDGADRQHAVLDVD